MKGKIAAARYMRRTTVLLACSAVIAGAVGVAVAFATSEFPASVYPSPIKARAHGALDLCPDPSGVQPFDHRVRKLAVRIASEYGRVSLAHDLDDSDRAWWPQVRQMWRAGKPSKEALNHVVYGSGEPLSKNSYSVIVRFSCGQALVTKSLVVSIGPHQTHPPYCDACISSLFFIDRRGRALIYYLY